MDKNKIDIVIISYNTCELTLNCIRSIYDTAGEISGKIIVVDNASADNSVAEINTTFPDIIIIKNTENLGYAKAVNIGISYSDAEFVIVSNPDVIYKNDSIQSLVKTLSDNTKVGAVGPQQFYPNGNLQYSYGDLPGFKLGLKKLFFLNNISGFINNRIIRKNLKKVGYIDGAVMAVRRVAFDEVLGFDEDYFFFTEEADFCFKLKKAGWKIIHSPESSVIHLRGATSYDRGLNRDRIKMMIESKELFCKKHLSFQHTKIYMILEIISSLNLLVLWFLISLFCFGSKKEKAKQKTKFNSLYFDLWIDEFNKLMSSNER